MVANSRLLQGKQVSRRERVLLQRVVVDLFRVIPFSFFIIVPAMELLLPVRASRCHNRNVALSRAWFVSAAVGARVVFSYLERKAQSCMVCASPQVALKLFPNMIPSQFQDANQRVEKRQKMLRGRVETAKFLQVRALSFLYM